MPTTTLTPRELADLLVAQALSKDVLDALASVIAPIREAAKRDKNYGMTDDYGWFIRKMFLLSSQMYGERVQNYFAKQFKLTRVKANEAKGDLKDSNSNPVQHYEFKFSFQSPVKNTIDIVQIRHHHDIDGYYIMAADARYKFQALVFFLTKAQMAKECQLLRAASAHGTQREVANNQTKEVRLSIKADKGDVVFDRWCTLYLDRYKSIALNNMN